jgi:metal-responsive CopG/Arc/MetJ family transcriptional regulator
MAATFTKDRQATTYLTPRMLERLDRYAESREMQRAEAIRRLIEEGIERFEANLTAE